MTQAQKFYAGKLIREVANRSDQMTNEQLWDLIVRIVKDIFRNTGNTL